MRLEYEPAQTPRSSLAASGKYNGRSVPPDNAIIDEAIDSGWGGILWLGEAGSGKSTLIERSIREIEQREPATVTCIRFVAPPSTIARPRQGEAMESAFRRLERIVTNAENSRFMPLTSDLARSIDEDADETTSLLVERLESIASGGTIVAVADDLDRFDELSRKLILTLAPRCRFPFIVLATARDQEWAFGFTHPLKTVNLLPCEPERALRELRCETGRPLSPLVAASLCERLSGNIGAIVQTATLLSDDQRLGARALPDPLPVTPAIVAVHEDSLTLLNAAERFALLVASVSVVDRTDVLLIASGLQITEIIRGRLASYLHLVSGRFAILDLRIRSLVHGSASLADRTEAHTRLAAAHEALAECGLAAWHRSLSNLEGDPARCGDLIDLASAALERGDSSWAHAIAREAASQAVGHQMYRAETIAGVAALLSGHVYDALDWLSGVLRCAATPTAARALVPYTLAVTLAEGYVPDSELIRFARATLSQLAAGDSNAVEQKDDIITRIVEAHALAAALHAERGCRTEAALMLNKAQALAEDRNIHSEIVELATAWCVEFGVHEGGATSLAATMEPSVVHGFAAVAEVLMLAGGGHLEQASRILSSTLLNVVGSSAQNRYFAAPGSVVPPLLDAQLRVTQALVNLWAGKQAKAAEELDAAAYQVPVSLPFAGLGVAATRRLGITVRGELGTVSEALEALLPAPTSSRMRRELQIDHAMLASFDSRPTEAATFLSLANEQGVSADSVVLPLPCIDEVILRLAAGQHEAADEALKSLMQADIHGREWLVAARVRGRLALASNREIGGMVDEAIRVSRSLVSLSERALTELALSRALTRAGEMHSARAHQVSAAELFFQSGATAFARHVRELSESLASGALADESSSGFSRGRGAPDSDLMSWADGLTEREREVALLVVQGKSNREVASVLFLSVRTIEVHLGRVFTKLGVRSRTELSYLVHHASAEVT